MGDDLFLVCPACEHSEPAEEPTRSAGEPPACPACGSDRTYLHHAPGVPDATNETFVKTSGPDEETE